MNLLTAEHITQIYADKKLFSDASFSLNDHEKVGIIGINGTGKSTLLKILSGLVTPDQGTVVMGNNLKICYLPQTPDFNPNHIVLESVVHLTDTITDSWNLETEAKTMLNRLGIVDYSQLVTELSGGQRKRIALVRALLSNSDILVLDEPTNHLDSAMSEWLEQYLKNFRGAIIMVTHDRYFLDSVANRIVEIDKGNLFSYQENYLGFLQRKAEREEIMYATERKRQNLLRTEIEWMQRGARARSTKQKAHIQRYEELKGSVGQIETDGQVEMNSVASRLGKTTVELDHISKSYQDHVLIKDFTYHFLRNDRIGIIGPNGCGKSTLMKMINGLVEPDEGTITIGQTVKIGYFSQENEAMDQSLRVIDYVRKGAEIIHTSTGTITASQMLERFLFTGDMQYSIINALSGGERRRLFLLRILMEAPNILFLDEPTNDLDIKTLTILEDYLDTFPGIVVTVSHDRYFLDRVVRRIFAFDTNHLAAGTLTQYEGGYTDYLHKLQEKEEIENSPSSLNGKEKKVIKDKKNWKDGQEKKRKLTYKEQKEYDSIEDEISNLEETIEQLEKDMVTQANNYPELMKLSTEKEAKEKALEEKMQRWVELEELVSLINKENE